MGTHFWFFPRFVDIYDVDAFRALIFDVSKKTQATLFDSYMINQETGERVYFETASTHPIQMVNVTEIPTTQACQDIFWMKPPFVTYQFPEGDDWYRTSLLISDAKTGIDSTGTAI